MRGNRTLLSVSLAVCAASLGLDIVLPVRVLYAQSHGASLAIIGTMSSAYFLSNFIFQYPGGWLADHWGRWPLMIISLLAQAALSLLYLWIVDPIWFVVLRFVEGMAATVFLPSARALITDAIPAERLGEAFGIFGAFLNVGFLLGPALGGLLGGVSDTSAFLGAIVFRLIALVLVLLLPRAVTQQKRATQKVRHPLAVRELFALPLFGAYLFAFGDSLFVGFDMALAALWMTRLGASITWIGISYVCWSLPTILLARLTGKLADRKRRSSLILLFGLAQVPIYIAYGLSNTFWIVLVLFVFHGTFWIFVQPAADAHLANAAPEVARARIQGLYSGMGLLGGFVGASGFGMLYTWNFRLPLFALGLGYGLCILISGLMIRFFERKRDALIPLSSASMREAEASSVLNK